jgi:hypothetical protein
MMTDNLHTCIDPYLHSFAQSFAVSNYEARTIKVHRQLARNLGRLMDGGGIAPSALTPDVAERLARTAMPGRENTIRFHNLARRFADHLIEISGGGARTARSGDGARNQRRGGGPMSAAALPALIQPLLHRPAVRPDGS